MACCAFVVLIVGQLYFLTEGILRRFNIRLPGRPASPGAAEWRPHAAASTTASANSLPRRGRRLAMVVAGSMAISGGAMAAIVAMNLDDARLNVKTLLENPYSWCGSLFRSR
jgi:hypothetical protein